MRKICLFFCILNSTLNAQVDKNIDIPNLLSINKISGDTIMKSSWDSRGKLEKEIFYCNDEKILERKWFYGDSLYGYKIKNFKKGNKEIMRMVMFYNNSGIRCFEGNFYKKKMNGYFIEYYSTGQKFRESFFLKGLLISSKYFDISGSEISNGDFFLGTGQLLIFNQNGVICEEQVYKNGKRLK